ncbi:hypothetical protein [Oceanicola sp. S124]|uniref:hypothetical protein n=1 Tax=Oceanicola sp. S124 TaxID=1042378 RepID=UPI00110FDC82|nr:hypothetical protein [Oceanicola sp. S124]
MAVEGEEQRIAEAVQQQTDIRLTRIRRESQAVVDPVAGAALPRPGIIGHAHVVRQRHRLTTAAAVARLGLTDIRLHKTLRPLDPTDADKRHFRHQDQAQRQQQRREDYRPQRAHAPGRALT